MSYLYILGWKGTALEMRLKANAHTHSIQKVNCLFSFDSKLSFESETAFEISGELIIYLLLYPIIYGYTYGVRMNSIVFIGFVNRTWGEEKLRFDSGVYRKQIKMK